MEARDGRGLRGRRLRGAAPPPWPRMPYDEAIGALRHRPARHALRPGDPRRLRRAARHRSSRSSRASWAAAASCARSTPARRELSRSELDGLNEVVQRHGGKAVAWADRRGRRLALADREVLLAPSRSRAVDARARGRRGRPAAVRRRPRRRSRPRRSAGCGWSSAALRAGPRGPPRRAVGRRLPDVRADATSRVQGRAAPSVHGAERRPRRPGVDAARAPTTSSSTAGRSAAARSASTRPRSRAASSSVIGLDAEEAQGALRLPARRAALRRAAARRHRDGHRPHRRAAGRPRVDPRRDRLPEDRQRRRPADRRARAGRRAPAARAGAALDSSSRPRRGSSRRAQAPTLEA